MFKKSQAALEFLTTYAWAFLVILIMIGALTYFGIFKPSEILPDRCNFGTEIGCVDYVIDYSDGSGTEGQDGTFDIKLKNSVGESIVIPSIATTGFALSTDSADDIDCTLATIGGITIAAAPFPPGYDDATGNYNWGSGEMVDFGFTDCMTAAVGFRPGNKDKIFITITYYASKSGGTYLHEVKGEVYTTVT